MRLRQAAAAFYGTSDLVITPGHFNTTHFINGVDLEKVGHQGASHSGLSTKNGDIVQLSVQNSPLSTGESVLVYRVYDGLMSIKDGSVDVFE